MASVVDGRSLPFPEWPKEDQQRWLRAFTRGSLRDPQGLAMHWRPDTRTKIEREYGRWLTFSQATGGNMTSGLPADRVTSQAVATYVTQLQQRVQSVTVASYVIGLSEALRVMQPGHKRTFIKAVVASLKRQARPSRDYTSRLCAPSELYDAGVRRMLKIVPAIDAIGAALRYGDGLMMALLAAKALRLRNLTQMRVGIHLVRLADGRYEVRFARSETKTHVEIKSVLPASLSSHIDVWLRVHRPLLLAGKGSDAMWLKADGQPMTDDAIYRRFCAASFDELERRINPHLARRINATGLAIAAPELVEIIPGLLDHSKNDKDLYNMADRLTASSQMLNILEPRRQAAIKGTTPNRRSLNRRK